MGGTLKEDALTAFRDSIPVMMGYIPLGIVYGFLFTQAGAEWWWVLFFSVTIYSGAIQYVQVPMLAAGASFPTLCLAAFVLGLRHVFYGLSLLSKYPARGPVRWYMVFALTDETYSLFTVMPEGASHMRMFFLALMNQCWWVTGSMIGAVAGLAAEIDLAGIDFVLTSLFAMLVCEQWRTRKTSWPLWAGLAGFALAAWLVPGAVFAAAIAIAAAVGLAWGALEARHAAAGGGEP